VPVHEQGVLHSSWAEAREAIPRLAFEPLAARVVSAHVMGGCGMAATAEQGVVDANGRHWQLENLSVHDGSVFPTSIGANPQLSIYGLTARNASRLAAALTGRSAVPGS
jgi:choline dehydrogenase-like flavoprotein